MRYRLHELNMPLDYSDAQLKRAAATQLHLRPADLTNFSVIRRSIDARKIPQFSFTVEFDLKSERREDHHLKRVEPSKRAPVMIGASVQTAQRPVVVGAGPAGLMAALILARNGLRPLLIERGQAVGERSRTVKAFWDGADLDPEDNALYGEGGAGLFSDGKLTSRSKDRPGIRYFMQTLVDCGADESLLIDAEPHLGTDAMKRIVPKLRQAIIEAGGEVRFNARLDKIISSNGRVSAVIVNGEEIATDACILAIGHSARDTYMMLVEQGVELIVKPFAVGVRVELPQAIVDRQQYGRFAGHERLGAASFRLTRKGQGDIRNCYTFCMCPGGFVIPCASGAGEFSTNGMSYHDRGGELANAAFLVPVTPDDVRSGKDPLGGIQFQRQIEQAVFKAGGSDYSMPVSSLSRFLKPQSDAPVSKTRSFERVTEADLHKLLPNFIAQSLRKSIPPMLSIFGRINHDDVTLYGAETRSSSPVRISREKDGQANIRGIFPCGEGAGYAGGIVSSALDGIRQAENLIRSI